MGPPWALLWFRIGPRLLLSMSNLVISFFSGAAAFFFFPAPYLVVPLYGACSRGKSPPLFSNAFHWWSEVGRRFPSSPFPVERRYRAPLFLRWKSISPPCDALKEMSCLPFVVSFCLHDLRWSSPDAPWASIARAFLFPPPLEKPPLPLHCLRLRAC